jgi:uncharacterized protein DUF4190
MTLSRQHEPVIPGRHDPRQPNGAGQRRRPGRRLATAALICALLGLLTCGVGSIVALVLGRAARRQIRGANAGGSVHGEGLVRAGAIVGWIGIAWYACVAVLVVALAIWASHQPDSGVHHHHHWHFHD